MNPVLLIVLIMLLLGGVVGGVIFFVVKKLDLKGGDASEDPNIKTVQEFLPFEDIRDQTIILSNHKYRAVIECSSTNYNLRTQDERAIIEMSFQRFLNSISFPITIFMQTRVIDNSKRLQMLKQEIKETLAEFPNLASYAEQYERDMNDLNAKIGNSQQKKRYIIVPYDDVVLLDNLSEDEKIVYAAKEIRSRCDIISNNLEAVGISTNVLSTEKLIELVYSCYNRDDYSYAEAIASKEPFSMFVHGEHDRFKDIPPQAMLDVILNETINHLEINGMDENVDGAEVLRKVHELREQYGYVQE